MKRRSRGLTLIELVVVLAILAAVAGIVAPLLPNMQRRAHKATEATQAVEVAKAIQLFQGLHNGDYPSNFDLLTDGTTFPSYLPAEDGNVFGGYATVANLTTTEAGYLRNAGVATVQTLATTTGGTGFHPTMNPYANAPAATPTAVSSSVGFAVINTTSGAPTSFLQALRIDDPTSKFIVLGVGSRSSMVGNVIQEAPTITPGSGSFTPANSYSRVGVIFKVNGAEISGTNGAKGTERARFVAAVILEDDAIETSEEGIVDYYALQQSGNAGS